jgi:putative toxin-antitoxin system antitoxin component (TIGR02293 family)
MPTERLIDVIERVTEVLGGPDVLQKDVRTWGELDLVVRDGLPKRSLQMVARRAAESGRRPSEVVYSVVPAATFKRRSRLTADESARTERLARMVALCEALWTDQADARAFLNRRHPLLDGETPLAVAGTEPGA